LKGDSSVELSWSSSSCGARGSASTLSQGSPGSAYQETWTRSSPCPAPPPQGSSSLQTEHHKEDLFSSSATFKLVSRSFSIEPSEQGVRIARYHKATYPSLVYDGDIEMRRSRCFHHIFADVAFFCLLTSWGLCRAHSFLLEAGRATRSGQRRGKTLQKGLIIIS